MRPGGGFVPNFLLTAKTDVNGDKQHKLYEYVKVLNCYIFLFFLSDAHVDTNIHAV